MPSTSEVSQTSPSRGTQRNIFLAAKGSGITFAGIAFAYVIRLAIGTVLARLLGVRQFGLYNLALAAATIAVGLALLGLPSAMVRYVSAFSSRRDEAGLWGVLQVGLGLSLVVSLLVAVGLFALSGPIAEGVFHEPDLARLLRLACLIVPFLTLNNIIAAATRGFKNMRYTAIAQNIIQPLVRLMLVVAFALFGLTAAGAISTYIVGLIVACVLLVFFLNRQFSFDRPFKTARRPIQEIFRFSLPIHLTNLAQTFRGNLQTVLLGTLNTISGVGIFAAASRVNLIGRMFHESIATASRPIVSELYEHGEWQTLARVYQTTTKWTFTLNLPMFMIVVLFPATILSIFGVGFVEGAMALSILAWRNLVEAGTGICGVVIDMTGRTTLRLINSVIITVLMLVLNFLLIPRWGMVGAAAAALVSTLVINLLRVSEIFFLYRMLPYDVDLIKPIAAGLVALAVAWSTRELFHTDENLIFAAINATLLLAAYAGMIMLLGLSQEDRAVLARLRAHTGRLFSK